MKREYNVDKTIFQHIDSEEKAYWLGFIDADGCMTDKTRIQMILKASDVGHLEKMKKFLKWSGDVKIHRYKTDQVQEGFYSRCELVFRCKPMFEDLLALGCHPKKSGNLSFPTEEQVPKEFLVPFVRGYVDGNGSLGKLTKGNYDYPRFSFCGTYDFVNDAVDRMGWKRNKIRVRDNGLAMIEWQGKYAKEYAHQLYDDATIYLDRKYKIVNNLPF